MPFCFACFRRPDRGWLLTRRHSIFAWLPRVTIERLRTVVLIGGGVLVLSIGIFLGLGQWRLYRQLRDLPGRLGINIQQQADGVDYTQSRKGKTLFKLHAARAVQMKTTNKMLLHDVHIDLYGDDGTRTDTIAGSEFEYDRNAGVAEAAGDVEISIMRPGVKPAITQLAEQALKPGSQPSKPVAPTSTSGRVVDNEVHVKTSGLIFNQKTGIATTSKRVDFVLQQGKGSSTGATYNSTDGQLVLDRDVALHVDRDGDPVDVIASHAEFKRKQQVCQMTAAKANYSGGQIQTGNALIHFRDDGSVIRLDGSDGVDLKTDKGSHVTAPRGDVEFDQQNHPRQGLLQGGTSFDLNQAERHIQGSAPTARLLFTGEGELHHAHLEKGVVFNSWQQAVNAKGVAEQVNRSWKSELADVDFVEVSHAHTGTSTSNEVEARTVHGAGSVLFTSETISNSAAQNPVLGSGKDSSRLSADDVVAEFAPGGAISTLAGKGHTAFEQTTYQGTHQTSNSDQLDARFVPDSSNGQVKRSSTKTAAISEASEIASIIQIGNVSLTQDSKAKQGQAPELIRATAARSDYDGSTQVLHLSGNPRVRDGDLDMTATFIEFARASGNASAHGNVKASWMGSNGASGLPGASLFSGGNPKSSNSSGPIHAIAPEAELNQATQEVILRADPTQKTSSEAQSKPRLWQGANSVNAPIIVLNRLKQTLVAESKDATDPVRTVLETNPASAAQTATRPGTASTASEKKKQTGPTILRVTSGDLHYSEAERIAHFHAGPLKNISAQTSGADGTSNILSQNAEVKLLPAGVRPAPRTPVSGSTDTTQNSPTTPGNGPNANSSSIDQLTAEGQVSVIWPDRKGTGEKLVYFGDSGDFTLTGTASMPPKITDLTQGTVTGSALVYHTRDESVTVEGDGAKTSTQTQAPKKRPTP